jgi:hypothetical protein
MPSDIGRERILLIEFRRNKQRGSVVSLAAVAKAMLKATGIMAAKADAASSKPDLSFEGWTWLLELVRMY